jgi:glutamate-5-semialdehyde dehydrogenase
MELTAYTQLLGRQARAAACLLAAVPTRQKDDWLRRSAAALEQHQDELLQANAGDVALAQSHELTPAQVDRLRQTPERITQAAAGLREIAQLPDPVGQVLSSTRRPNALEIHKVAVPLGVIFFVYESRPNVTVDAAGLCVKSGNAVILRGGKESLHSNLALHRLLSDCLDATGLPTEAVQLVDTSDRAAVGQLLRLNQFIDLVIPRGGESLIRRVAQEATMPVLKHYQGNCHIYVDQAADLDMAERIIVNAKCQRPGVCNATESLLVHRAVAGSFLPRIGTALAQRGVKLRGCAETRRWLPAIEVATEEDYGAEYLDLILSVKVVATLEEAMQHIGKYGSAHTDAIVTKDLKAARQFTGGVDSAAVLVNASTRCHDGHEFGLGAEIGISTDKFHARGPCGLLELCSYKYVVYGDGHIRE